MRCATNHLVELSRDECMKLLGSHHLGRLAVVIAGQPLIFPVNYALDGRQIVFRTAEGTKLLAARGHRVAFEVDDADYAYHEGWSVMVVGVAREEHDARRLDELARLPLRPWGSGPKSHWICISGGAITGRRLTHLADI